MSNVELSNRYNIWTGNSPQKAFEAQQKLLEGLNHQSKLVKIDKDHINTIIMNEDEKEVLVMCHGYMAGLGCNIFTNFVYFKTYGLLSTLKYKIYSVDWLGMANSSRPEFIRSTGDIDQDVHNAEDFFVDSLEKWRIQMGVDSMTLLGHSLGGYLSACYSIKYPERVKKLILVSPAGVPVANLQNTQFESNYLIKGFRKLWGWNVTPTFVMRLLGPFGSKLMQKYATNRFSSLDPNEYKLFENYVYRISALPGSGEYALARLLLPGAYARKPLHDRLTALGMPITFIYGDSDWMDFRHGLKAMQRMNSFTKLAVVRNAGHHLYLDNPEAFAYSVMNELQPMISHPHIEYFETAN
jgi:pimeloyl-ACP methyl ester carboxylesterase